jgi:hypothetical protein
MYNHIATILFFFVTCAHAMDLSLFFTHNSSYDDFKEPIVLQRSYENYVDELAFELQGKIVKDMFNFVVHQNKKSKKYIDQKKLEKYILHIPILLGIKFVDELSQWQKICQNKIGNRKLIAQDLFSLPNKERDVFMRVANRSLFRAGDIDGDDFRIIVDMTNKNVRRGLSFSVNYLKPALDYTKNVSSLATFFGMLNFLIMLNIPVKYEKRCKGLLIYVFVGNCVILVPCFIMTMLCNFLVGSRHGPDGYIKNVSLSTL